MAESLFTKIFSYRQRENNRPLENFLTEIFAFCLENDWDFRQELFKSLLGIDLQNNDEFNISTQKEYEDYGRPDIEIIFNDTVILFECKVEAGERLNQLKDYTDILIEEKQEYAKKHLIYLTKYFEQKDEPLNNTVTLNPVRWFQIYELISESHSEITKQLKSFLKENNMEKPKNFYKYKTSLQRRKALVKLCQKWMNFWGDLNKSLKHVLVAIPRNQAVVPQLKNDSYINNVSFYYEKVYYELHIGFFWNYEDVEIPNVGLCITIWEKYLSGSNLKSILDKELTNIKGWRFEKCEGTILYEAAKPYY